MTLQTWGVTDDDINVVGEVNPDKDGSFTPGTWILIRNEDYVIEEYDVFVVLPWHFINEFKERESEFLKKGGKFIVPCPKFEIIGI